MFNPCQNQNYLHFYIKLFYEKTTLFIGLLLFLLACTTSKDISTDPELVENFDNYEFNEFDSTALYEDYSDFEYEEELKVRAIYNGSRTLYTDLIHTKLEVNFNWAKSQLNGLATITAKPHFHASDSLVLDAKGMDIKKLK